MFLTKVVEIEQNEYKTTGKIIEVTRTWEWRSGRLGYYYEPIIQFIDENGETLELKMDAYSTASWFFTKGKVISIVYYEGKIFPTGFGWILFCMMFVLVGIGITAYNIVIRFL